MYKIFSNKIKIAAFTLVQKHDAEAETRLEASFYFHFMKQNVHFVVGVPETKLCLSQSQASIV
jgi:hypothetical protein